MEQSGKVRWWKRVRIEEWLAVFLFITVMLINLLGYNDFSWKDTTLSMLRYFTFGNSFYVIFSLCLYIVFFFWGFRQFSQDILGVIFDREPFQKKILIDLGKALVEPVRILAPIVLISVSFFELLSNFDVTLQQRTQDLLFYHADKLLFGASPFITLPTMLHQPFFVLLFGYLYTSLAPVMSVLLFYLFVRSRERLFRLNLIAYILTLVLAFPIYYVLPCKDPSNAFIFRPAGELPSDVRSELAGYHPSPETMSLLLRIHNAEFNEKDQSVPVSCFPSMHAAWSFATVFFLALIHPWTLLFSIPWILLVLSGGVYFGQHYVVDYLVAIPVIVISILGAYGFAALEKKWNSTKGSAQ